MSLSFLLAILLGAGAATGQRLIIIGLLGIVGGLAVLAVPVAWTFWTMMVMSFVVVGPVAYFLHIGQVQWLPALLGTVLYVQFLVVLVTRRVARGHVAVGAPAFVYLLIIFWLAVTFSSAIARISPVEALMGSRYYFFVWGALMVFFVGAVGGGMIDRLWKTLLLFACLQLPFVVYQYLFVARKRATGEVQSGGAPPWDAVIGTFPGVDTGGGNSAAMGFFVLSMMLLAIALWREKHLSASRALVVGLCALGAIALAEVKAIVLLIPVALALHFRRELLRHPVQALVAVVFGLLLSALLLLGYQKVHYDNRVVNPEAELANATVIERMQRALDPENVNESSGKIGRVANLVRWWGHQGSTSDLYRTFFGHGIGTTQESNLELGTLFRKYGPDIGSSSLIILLWETGIVGTIVYSFLLAAGATLSARLSRDERIPSLHRTYLGVGAVVLLLLLLTLPYKPYAVRLTSIQLLMVLVLGQAYYWWRTTRILQVDGGLSQTVAAR